MISIRRGRARTLRRGLILLLLLALGTSAGEATAGTLRESWTHREATASVDAASPTAPDREVAGSSLQRTASGDVPDAPPARSRTPDHGHVGTVDHCGHLHGNAMLPGATLVFLTTITRVPVASIVHLETPHVTTLRRPPRA